MRVLVLFLVCLICLVCLGGVSSAVTVNQNESIQDAINTLSNGGIIELTAGTWNITYPIRINKSNVILRGQGVDITIINQTTTQEDAIIVSIFYDYVARDDWLYQNLIKWDTMLQWFDDNSSEVVDNTSISNMTVITTGSSIEFSNIGATEVTNLSISDSKLIGDSTTNDPHGIFVGHYIDVTIENTTVDGVGGGIKLYGGSYNGNVLNTTISNTERFTVIEYNGARGLNGQYPTISGNKLSTNKGSIYVYASEGVNVSHNIISDVAGSAGIWVNQPTDKNNIYNNTIYNIYYDGFGNGIRSTQNYVDFNVSNSIYNNLIYNVDYGINLTHYVSGTFNIKDSIYSNTINNALYAGINNPQNQPLTMIKNNIVTNSNTGIEYGNNISYNNVWNNTNNYANCTAGSNDISSNPQYFNISINNYHLKSNAGGWNGTGWENGSITSQSIDYGDVLSEYSNEPSPNGNRINLGAYGNTVFASKSTFVADNNVNYVGVINSINRLGVTWNYKQPQAHTESNLKVVI